MTEGGTRRRAFLTSAAAGAVGLGVQRVAFGGASAQQQADGLLVFTYDDAPAEDYTRAYEEAHQPEGVPGCSAVPSARVGGSGWLSSDQIQEMDADGWEIMSHSVIHRALAPIPLTQDAAAGDTRLYTKYDFHGKQPGDTIEVTDGDTSEVATVAGRGEDDDGSVYVTVEEPLEHGYAVADDAVERYTEDVIRTALGDSKDELEREHGVDVSHAVMPYAGYGERTQSVAPDYYTAVANAGDAANWDRRGLNPVDRIDLPELSRANFEASEMTEAEVESFLDRVASEDVLGILGGHTWRHDELPPDRIQWTIQEAKERNVDVVTLSEALDRLGLTDPGTTTTTETTTTSTTTADPTTTTTADSTPTTSSTTTTQEPTDTPTTTQTPTTTPTTTSTPTTTTSSNGGGSSSGGTGGGGGGGGGQSFDRGTTTTTTATPTPTTTTTRTPTPTTTAAETTTTATSTTAPQSTTTSAATTRTTSSTTTGGQPGFGWLAALGGLASAAAYVARRATDDEE